MNSLEGLRKRSLDLQDSEAFEEWVGALKREGLLDKETEGALRLYFFFISFLNLKKKDIDAFSKAVWKHGRTTISFKVRIYARGSKVELLTENMVAMQQGTVMNYGYMYGPASLFVSPDCFPQHSGPPREELLPKTMTPQELWRRTQEKNALETKERWHRDQYRERVGSYYLDEINAYYQNRQKCETQRQLEREQEERKQRAEKTAHDKRREEVKKRAEFQEWVRKKYPLNCRMCRFFYVDFNCLRRCGLTRAPIDSMRKANECKNFQKEFNGPKNLGSLASWEPK